MQVHVGSLVARSGSGRGKQENIEESSCVYKSVYSHLLDQAFTGTQARKYAWSLTSGPLDQSRCMQVGPVTWLYTKRNHQHIYNLYLMFIASKYSSNFAIIVLVSYPTSYFLLLGNFSLFLFEIYILERFYSTQEIGHFPMATSFQENSNLGAREQGSEVDATPIGGSRY